MAEFNAGTAYVSVLPSLDKFKTRIKAELASVMPKGIDVTVKPDFSGKWTPPTIPDQKVKVKVEIDHQSLERTKSAVNALGTAAKGLGALGAVGGAANLLTGAAGAATALSGSLLLLPGAVLAGGAALATLKLGTAGVGDAFKAAGGTQEEFNKAVAGLAPNARDTAVAVRTLYPELKSLQQSVQNNLFAGFSGQVADLGRTYLPTLRTGLGGIATEMNGMALSATKALMAPSAVNDVNEVLTGTRGLLANMQGTLGNVVSGFLGLGGVGATYLPALGTAIDGVTLKFKAWVDQGVESGRINELIDQGIVAFRDLGGIVYNVGAIVGTVLSGISTGTGSFLGSIRETTGAVLAFLQTAQGQTALASLGETLRVVGGVMRDILLAALRELAPILEAAAPVVQKFALAFGETLVGAIQIIGPMLTGIFNTLNSIPGIGYIIMGLVGAFAALSLTISIVRTGMAAWATMQAIIKGATIAWTAVQWLLNAALSANPIALLVIGIAALVAAVIYAWNNFGWFRDIVIGAWQGIQTAASWAWNTILKPIFDGIAWVINTVLIPAMTWLWQNVFVPAWNAIAGAVSWAWNTILSPIFGFLDVALRFIAAVVMTVLLLAFRTAWELISGAVSLAWNYVIKPIWDALVWTMQNVIAPAVMWLWNNIIKPAWDGIGAAIAFVWNNIIKPLWDALVWTIQNIIAPAVMWLWNNIIKPAWDGIGAAIAFVWNEIIKPLWDALVWVIQNVIAPAVMWLWNNIIKPAWDGIGAAIAFVWNEIIKPLWDALVWVIQNVIAPAVMWLWNNIIKPAWDGIGAVISFIWNEVIKPAFDAVVGGLNWLGDNFVRVTDWIGDIWNRIRGFLAKPINFMIDTVWNKGVVPAWNAVAGLVGLGPIGTLPLIAEYAQGGFSENHRAQISRAGGPMRVWSEPETGGEAYIPLAASKRQRSTAILSDVANRFGLGVVRNRDVGMFAEGGIVAFGRRLQGMGYDVAEHPAFGGVGDHGARSLHYSGNAIDVNKGAGTSPQEQAALGQIVPMAREYALRTIFMSPGHYNHAHFDTGQGADIGGGGGGMFSAISTWFMDKARSAFDSLTNPAIDGLRGIIGAPPPAWREVVPALATKMRDTIRDFVFRKAGEKDAEASSGGGMMGPVGDGEIFVVKQICDSARAHGVGFDGASIGVATGIVESGLRNLNYGDRDSVGVFQQRGNGAWGNLEQRMNVRHASDMFFNKLVSFNWRGMDPGAAAQKVQASAFPARYGQQIPRARQLVSQHGGAFDNGGLGLGKGFMFKDVMTPERVLNPSNTRSFDTMVGMIASGRLDLSGSGGDSGGGPLIGEYHTHLHGDNNEAKALEEVDYRMRIARRGGGR